MTPVVELVGALTVRLGHYGLHIVHTSDSSIRIQHTAVHVRFETDYPDRYSHVCIKRKHRDRPRVVKIIPGARLSRASLHELTVAVLYALLQDAREDAS